MNFRSGCFETFGRNANDVRAIPRSARVLADGVGAKRGVISLTAAMKPDIAVIRTTLR